MQDPYCSTTEASGSAPESFDVTMDALSVARLSRNTATGDVFGRTATLPFIPSTVRRRALKAWKAASLEPLTPHEARHCAISYFIACGHDRKQVSAWAGHSDVRQTWNRYGKVIPGAAHEAGKKLDAYLDRTIPQTVPREPENDENPLTARVSEVPPRGFETASDSVGWPDFAWRCGVGVD